MKVGFEGFGEVICKRKKDGFEDEASDEGEAGLSEKLPESEAANESGGFKNDRVEKVSEEGGAKSAEPEFVEVLRGVLTDFDEEKVVEALTAPEAEDAGEEDAASHAGDSDEGGVVGAGVIGESGDDPEEDTSQKAESEPAGRDGVGGAFAVDFDDEVAEDVGDREHDDSAVDWDAEKIPEFDGGEVCDNDHAAHDGAHDHKVAGGFGGHWGVVGIRFCSFHRYIL